MSSNKFGFEQHIIWFDSVKFSFNFFKFISETLKILPKNIKYTSFKQDQLYVMLQAYYVCLYLWIGRWVCKSLSKYSGNMPCVTQGNVFGSQIIKY